MNITRPALRYHGGKFRLAAWIMQFFPSHSTYTEVFGGGGSVLLQKPRSRAEIYNDLDGEIVNFFRVLRDPKLREQLIEAIALTPYSRDEFVLSYGEVVNDPVESARRTAIRSQMGFGSAGATKQTTGLRIDTQRRYTTAMMDWSRYPDAIEAAGQRFTGVLIENRPAIEVLLQHDTPETLNYVDPPYMHGTRVMNSAGAGARAYRHEMSDADHSDLLDVLDRLTGYVVLSGYPNDLYESRLKHWSRYSTTARISAGRGTGLREEVVWINPTCQTALDGLPLFLGVA